jgi:hypothetical protein
MLIAHACLVVQFLHHREQEIAEETVRSTEYAAVGPRQIAAEITEDIYGRDPENVLDD